MSSCVMPVQVLVTPTVHGAATAAGGAAHGAVVSGAGATMHVGAAAGQALASAAMAVGTAVAVGAVTILVSRVAADGAARAADQLIALGEELAAQRGEALDRRQQAILWEAITSEVVERNARIMALTARVARLGDGPADGGPPLPTPIRITGHTPCQLDDWCRAVDEVLPGFERQLAVRASAAFFRAAEARRPVSGRAIAVADAPDARPRGLEPTGAQAAPGPGRREGVPPAAVPAGRQLSEADSTLLRARIERHTGRLDPEAVASDVEAVLRLGEEIIVVAERAAAGGGSALGAASSRLTLLATSVAEANARSERSREAALTAARYLQALEQPVDDELPDGPVRAAAAALRAVVAGERELDDTLLAEVELQRARVENAALRRHALETIRAAMTDNLGYSVGVTTGTLVGDVTHLRLTRPGWEPDHHAELVIRNGRITGALVRDSTAASDDADREDRERCDELLADFERLGALLTGAATAGGDGSGPARAEGAFGGAADSVPLLQVSHHVQRSGSEETARGGEDDTAGGAPLHARERTS